MNLSINPFQPNNPVNNTMFVGRSSEIEILQRCIVQTRAGHPSSFLILGERGIGKTSLLNYVNWLANGNIKLYLQKVNFLVVHTDIQINTSIIGLLKKINLSLEASLKTVEPIRDFIKNSWGFMKRIEAMSVKINEKEKEDDIDAIVEQFSYDIAKLAQRLCSSAQNNDMFENKYDGIIILIDEADNASRELNLGSFVKIFMERLQRHGCNNVMIGLAGLPSLRNNLLESHESSLRLFQVLNLERLSEEDTNRVIDICLEEGRKENHNNITINNEARELLHLLSEGYPHFIQQFGYSAYEINNDNLITKDDVSNGAYGQGGALENIGDRFYKSDFYTKIQNEAYRQVLRIMSEKFSNWITKKEIRKKFQGSDITLSNALRTLRNKNIILSKEGESGIYRLQQVGFALWIKLYTHRDNI